MNCVERTVCWFVILQILALGWNGTTKQAVAEWQLGEPIVTMWGLGLPALSDEVAQYAAEGGFNVVGVTRSAELTTALRYGLRAMYWKSSLLSPDAIGDPVLQPQLDALINSVHNHPAMYGYMLTDEPNAAEFPGLQQLVTYLHDHDSEHFGYINLFPAHADPSQLGASSYSAYLNQYLGIVQPSLLSSDCYQFTTTGDSPEYFQNLAALSGAARAANLPFLNIVQGNAHGPGYRVPNANELRFLNYTTLAYGAQGIMYWTGVNDNNDGPLEMPGSVYDALKSLNREFVAIAEQVQTTIPIGAYHLGDRPPGTVRLPSGSPFSLEPAIPNTFYQNGTPVKGFVVGLFGNSGQFDEATYALVVNLDYNSARTTTIVGPENLAIFDPTTGIWSPTGSHQAMLNLLPGGGALVSLASIEVPAFIPGDYDDNGSVDAADYVVWRQNLGDGTLPNETASPGHVDQEDYNQWRQHFGATALGSTVSAIPEPQSLFLVIVTFLHAPIAQRLLRVGRGGECAKQSCFSR
jgi:hypothetical protein